ncbi:hypothetical protein D1007_31299 [Hordeum vulgare]|nr:hypothetical protein D1007_31299 [Hordeum vulgare]
MENGWKANESVWLNGSGAVLYFVYLVMFVCYTDVAHRRITIEWLVPGAVLYLLVTAVVGVLPEWTLVVKLMCTLAGLASACASLMLTLFVLEKKMEFLPDRVSTMVSLLHYCMWVARDVIATTRDWYDFVQNICGLGCSSIFLVLPFMHFFWTRNQTQAKPILEDREDLSLPLIPPHRGPPSLLHQPLSSVNQDGAEPGNVQNPALLPVNQDGVEPDNVQNPAPLPINQDGAEPSNVHNPALLPINVQIHALLPINLEAANVLQEPRRVLSAPSTPEQRVDDLRRKSA